MTDAPIDTATPPTLPPATATAADTTVAEINGLATLRLRSVNVIRKTLCRESVSCQLRPASRVTS